MFIFLFQTMEQVLPNVSFSVIALDFVSKRCKRLISKVRTCSTKLVALSLFFPAATANLATNSSSLSSSAYRTLVPSSILTRTNRLGQSQGHKKAREKVFLLQSISPKAWHPVSLEPVANTLVRRHVETRYLFSFEEARLPKAPEELLLGKSGTSVYLDGVAKCRAK